MSEAMNDPVASLTTIPVSKLLESDDATAAQLLKACTEVGFFYLDLRSPKTSDTLSDVEHLFKTTDDLFKLDVDEKRQYNTDKYNDSKVHGYREVGINIGPLEGKKDGYESFMVSELGLFGLGNGIVPFAGPGPVQDAKQPLTTCIRSLHDISLAILSNLYESLGRPEGIPFQDCHRQDQASMTGLGLLQYQPLSHAFDKVGHLAHTDAGSLSFVFTNSGGLQVLMPDDTWQYVEPRPGHAVVNVGDTLTFLSKGKLKSSLHRVVPHPSSVTTTKTTVVYLLRPEFETRMEDSEGKVWTAADWHNRKFHMFRKATAAEFEASPVLTGRKGYLGRWEQGTGIAVPTAQ